MLESSIPIFQAQFREHYAGVVRKLMLLVGDQATAEDLAQDVFLKLYRSPPEHIAQVGAWLHRVLTTTAYDYMRQATRRQALLAKEQARSELEVQAVPSNEEAAFRNWEMEIVKRALGRLSERDRDALLLKQQGYSYQEIAERIGVKTAIVGSLLSRAEERLRRHYFTEEGVIQ